MRSTVDNFFDDGLEYVERIARAIVNRPPGK